MSPMRIVRQTIPGSGSSDPAAGGQQTRTVVEDDPEGAGDRFEKLLEEDQPGGENAQVRRAQEDQALRAADKAKRAARTEREDDGQDTAIEDPRDERPEDSDAARMERDSDQTIEDASLHDPQLVQARPDLRERQTQASEELRGLDKDRGAGDDEGGSASDDSVTDAPGLTAGPHGHAADARPAHDESLGVPVVEAGARRDNLAERHGDGSGVDDDEAASASIATMMQPQPSPDAGSTAQPVDQTAPAQATTSTDRIAAMASEVARQISVSSAGAAGHRLVRIELKEDVMPKTVVTLESNDAGVTVNLATGSSVSAKLIGEQAQTLADAIAAGCDRAVHVRYRDESGAAHEVEAAAPASSRADGS